MMCWRCQKSTPDGCDVDQFICPLKTIQVGYARELNRQDIEQKAFWRGWLWGLVIGAAISWGPILYSFITGQWEFVTP